MLLAAAHPDSGGTDELFVWAWQLRDVVCGGPRLEPKPTPPPRPSPTPPPHGPDRVPFPGDADFGELTDRYQGSNSEALHTSNLPP